MESKSQIIEILAKNKRVEALVENIAHHSLTADLKDLCQMVYLILLEYDESKLQDLWLHKEMDFFIVRIITNQYRSSNSPFHTIYRKYQEKSISIGAGVGIDEAVLERINRNQIKRREINGNGE